MADDIIVQVPRGPGNLRYQGAMRKLPWGFILPAPNGDYAIQAVALTDHLGNPIFVRVVHGDPDGLRPGVKLQIRAVGSAPAQTDENDATDVWGDRSGRIIIAAKDTAGQDQVGALLETAPTTDIAASGLNGRLQRIAQRITSLIALLPAALGAGGGLKVDGSGTALPVSVSGVALETGGNLAALTASASILDDWDESDRAKINPIVGVAGVQGNTGAVTTSTQRVTLATDVKLPAGDNIIGSIAGGGIFQAAQSVPIGSTSASGAAVGAVTNNRLMGCSFQENGSPSGVARFVLHNHATSASAPILYASLGPGESLRDWFGPAGKVASAGVYLEMISGTVVGQLDMKQVA